MPEPQSSMRFHLLAPDVKCPRCGGGLTFIRVRGKYGDLYQCKCRRQVIHHVRKGSKTCGYAVMYSFGTFGEWTPCRERPIPKG
jgi:hypothetical protein